MKYSASSNATELVNSSAALLGEGLVDRRIYADAEIYRLEQERVFARSWLAVAHVSQIPNPGDFIESYMGEDSVIVCRNRDGNVRVLLNTCRHQANKVCRAEIGNAATFICQYHGWSYDADGKFIGAPQFEKVYGADFDRENSGLLRAQVAEYKGLIFATFMPDPLPLEEFLGDFTWLMDTMLDPRPGGVEVAGNGFLRWSIKTNWKFPAENSGGDLYHGSTTHKSAIDIGHEAVTNYSNVRYREASSQLAPGCTMVSPHGHAVNWNEPDPGEAPSHDSKTKLAAYLKSREAETVKQLGEYRALKLKRFNANIFPNLGFHSSAQTLHIFHPRGPLNTEVWLLPLVDRNAPEDVKAEVRQHADQHFGPAGFFEEDDGDNWEQATAGCTGPLASRLPLNLKMGLGKMRKTTRPGSPELIEGAYNDYGQIALLERWHRLMQDQ